MHQQRTEGSTTFLTNSDEKISKKMTVFYNPVMQLNRDITMFVLCAYFKGRNPTVALPMEASGIRAARILHELVFQKLFLPKKILINDLSADAIRYAQENVELNIAGIAKEDMPEIKFSTLDASIFLRSQHPLDYIDLDPFGTPNPFLDAAVQKLARGGLIAVTATDTSALAGTYPKATAKKYWSVPTRTWLMHESGMRILARKVQLIGTQYDKALYPILSVSTDHYYRIFFRCAQSHTDVHNILSQHAYMHICLTCDDFSTSKENHGVCKSCGKDLQVAGPMWLGALHDPKIVQLAVEYASKFIAKEYREVNTVLASILEESRIDVVGCHDLHRLASTNNIQVPRRDEVIAILGSDAVRTQYEGHFIKTTLSKELLIDAMKKANTAREEKNKK